MKYLSLFGVILLAGVAVLAQDAVPVPAAVAPAVPHVLSTFDSISQWLMAHMVVSGGLAAGVIEFLIRFIPSDRPRSIFILASAIFLAVGNLLVSTSKFLDSIVQNLKKSDTPPAPKA